MNRFFLIACTLFLVTFPSSAGNNIESKDRPLNVILIISDDHGWRDSGCYGNELTRTPNLDQLASEGIRFTHAFAASTLCSPSRTVIATGLMPFRNGGHVFGGLLTPGTKTVAHFFNEIEYQTALIGKFSKHPYDAYPYEYVRKSWNVDEHDAGLIQTLDTFLLERDKNRPLYLEINTADTHMPWLENEEYELSEIKVPPHLVDTKETRDALADYYSSVNMLDINIGKILDCLKTHGYYKNTFLIYTSDHGPNFPFAKWCLYDEGIRIPFIVRWTRAMSELTESDAMISHADILPTILEAVGAKVPDDLDGISFLDVITGEKKEHRELVFANHTGHGGYYPKWKANLSPARTVRTRNHQYILNLNPNVEFICHITETSPERQPTAYHPYWDSWKEKARTDLDAFNRVYAFQHRPPEELYDLIKDPFERNNIVNDPDNNELLEFLRIQLSQWREQQGDSIQVFVTEEYIPPFRKQ